MTMLTPDDPGSGRLFFWTRQGISLQELYDIIDNAIAASGGNPAPPGGIVSGGDINAINILDSTDVGRAVLTAVGETFLDRQAAARAAIGATGSTQVDTNTAQIASINSQIVDLGTAVNTATAATATIIGTEVHIYCPGDVDRARNALGTVPPGQTVVFHKQSPPTIGGPYAQVNDGYEIWDG